MQFKVNVAPIASAELALVRTTGTSNTLGAKQATMRLLSIGLIYSGRATTR